MERETAIRVCKRLDEMFAVTSYPTVTSAGLCGLFGQGVADVFLQEKSEEEARAFLRGVKAFLEYDRIEGYKNKLSMTKS